jgi:hypothetical protein
MVQKNKFTKPEHFSRDVTTKTFPVLIKLHLNLPLTFFEIRCRKLDSENTMNLTIGHTSGYTNENWKF